MTRRRHFVYVSRSITSRGFAVAFQQNLYPRGLRDVDLGDMKFRGFLFLSFYFAREAIHANCKLSDYFYRAIYRNSSLLDISIISRESMDKEISK